MGVLLSGLFRMPDITARRIQAVHHNN